MCLSSLLLPCLQFKVTLRSKSAWCNGLLWLASSNSLKCARFKSLKPNGVKSFEQILRTGGGGVDKVFLYTDSYILLVVHDVWWNKSVKQIKVKWYIYQLTLICIQIMVAPIKRNCVLPVLCKLLAPWVFDPWWSCLNCVAHSSACASCWVKMKEALEGKLISLSYSSEKHRQRESLSDLESTNSLFLYILNL